MNPQRLSEFREFEEGRRFHRRPRKLGSLSFLYIQPGIATTATVSARLIVCTGRDQCFVPATVRLLRAQIDRNIQVPDKRCVAQEGAKNENLPDPAKKPAIEVGLLDAIQKLAQRVPG